MSQRWAALAMLLLAPIAGCAAEPFVRPPLPLLNDVNPQAMRDSFADRLPARFTSDDTLIIQAPFHHDVAILGVLRVNRAAGTFEMVGLDQLGVQLFYLSGDRNGEAVRSAIGPLQKQKDVLLAIAQDIRRMYFNLVPEKDAKIEIDSTTVRFTQATKHGELVYEFGGDPAVLLEKRHSGWFGASWRVRYYDYASWSGSLYPRGIVMDNGHYHYRIIVKNRDLGAR